MKRREFITLMIGSLVGRSGIAPVQGAAKMVRVGWLTAQREASLTPFLAALRSALTDLGYSEGGNLSLEYRFGDDQLDRVPRLRPS
jgi:putative ABC transport system substrate-binding protein